MDEAAKLRLSLPENEVTGASAAGTPMHEVRQASRRLDGDDGTSSLNLSLEWQGLSFTIGNHRILKEVTGLIAPGQLVGVLGPSGSGKTTLLNILAGRQNTKAAGFVLSGEITACGTPVEPVSFRRNIAYVMQEDALMAFETPREYLRFSACLRLSKHISREEREGFVESLLSTLHLHDCADTVVGSALVKGISGGEKKRTSVGVELITNPKMLFLDEPLSGLDSYAAFTLMEALKNLAATNVPVLCTVHQPSSEIFAMFDDVIILHAGEITYHGPASEMTSHFSDLGYPCPANFNPADHIMFLLQKEDSTKIQMIKTRWLSSRTYQGMLEKRAALQRDDVQHAGSRVETPGFCTKLCLLTSREVRETLRNRGILGARMGMSVFLSAMYGWLFAGSAAQGDAASSLGNCVAATFDAGQCTGDFQAHFGTLVSMAIMAMMGAAQPVLLQFPQERPVFLREYAANQYGVVSYFLSKTLVELPVVLTSNLLSFLIAYWWMGLHGSLVLLVLIAWALGIASSSLALLVGCGVASSQKAIQLAPLTLIPQMLFSGLFLPVAKIPASLRWVRFLCPLKYAIDLMTVVEFLYVRESMDDCEQSLSRPQCQALHPGDYLRDALVKNQSVEWDRWAEYLGALLGLLAAFRILALLLLWRKGKYVY
ncbi:unnamed protein product [Effrenium voratum]|nr:unnamed protein product [Effrenium voratum]